jgi:type III pantothenate kinase
MSLDLIVIDVGNTRSKVCQVRNGQLDPPLILPHDTQPPWKHPEIEKLLAEGRRWTLSGSNPPLIEGFASWLKKQDQQHVHVIDASTKLPIEIEVPFPEKVGRDRLLNAIAATEHPAIIISAGTAVTVDAVSPEGHFLGGAIMPGLGLMAEALYIHTAKLPRIELIFPRPVLPAKNTVDAINAGIQHAVLGGILGCHKEHLSLLGEKTKTYLTGGDGPFLLPYLPFEVIDSPLLTLHGIFHTARMLWP